MLPVLRHDLNIVPLSSGGAVRVEDPLSGECYEFTGDQWRAAQDLSLHRDLDDWLEQRTTRSNDSQQDRQGWTLFLQRLAQAGLLQGVARPISSQSGFFDPLAFALASIPTRPWLARLERVIRPAMSRLNLSFIAALTILTYGMLLSQWPRFMDEAIALPRLLSPWSLVLLAPLLMLTKTFHELGHAITAERMGARSREIGIMLFFGAPCLYADVSSVNLVPSQKARVAVTLAGSAVDLVVGAIAGWIWSLTQAGIVHDLAWLTLTVVVGSNLIFNLNPLMRFDGYYLLADLLGIPNLHRKAQRAWVLRRKQLGWSHWWSRADLPEASRQLACFALAALAYRTLVLAGISLAAIAWAATAGLGWAMATTLTLLLLRRYWHQRSRTNSRWSSSRKLGPSLLKWSLASALLLLLAMTPWRGRVNGEGSIYRARSVPLYAMESGRLIESKQGGQAIEAGEAWLSLVSPEVEAELLDAQARCEELERRIQSFERLGSDDSGESLATLEQRLETAQSKRNLLERRRDSLTPPAPIRGQLVSAHHLPPSDSESSPTKASQAWCGDPLHLVNRGAWIESGTLMGWVVPDNGSWEAVIAIDESDIAQIQLSDTATIWSRSGGKLTNRARVVRISSEAHEVTPDSWNAWLGSAGRGQLADDHVGLQTLHPRRSAWVLLQVETSEVVSDKVPRIHHEPVRVLIHTRPESMLSRAWRWWRTQVYLPW